MANIPPDADQHAHQVRSMAQHREAMRELLSIPGVIRVGYGLKETDGNLLHEWAYRVYVRRKRPMEDVSPKEQVPPEVGGIRTDVLVGAEEDTKLASKSPDLTPGMQITRWISGDPPAPGSVGLFVKHGTNRLLLTCHHVLQSDASLAPDTLDIYEPIRDTCLGFECGTKVARIGGLGPLADPDCKFFRGEVEVPEDLRTFVVDVAMAKINPDIDVSNVDDDLGAFNGLRDLIAEFDTGTLAPHIRLKKKGATTGVTEGILAELFNEIPGSIAPVFEFLVDGVQSEDGKKLEKDYELDPSEDAAAVVQYFTSVGVKATLEPTAGKTMLHLRGYYFALGGDSGSIVIDEQHRIVGMLRARKFKLVSIRDGNMTVVEEVDTARGVVACIHPAFAKLGLAAGDIIPAGNPSAGAAALRVPVERQPPIDRRALAELGSALERTLAGQRLLSLARTHFEQVAHLIHHRRRVMVSWHRNKGPAYTAAFIRAVRSGDDHLPKQIGGISLAEGLTRLRDALLQEGDESLRQAIQAESDWLIGLAESTSSVSGFLRALAEPVECEA